MKTETAFVGDIHGNLSALQGIWRALSGRGVQRTVFLGDYVNKGSDSAEVLSELISLANTQQAVLLRGNHERALLKALEGGDLGPFLRLGGAATIRSYVSLPVGADVLTAFRASVPDLHLETLRGMAESYETDELIATHVPRGPGARFQISAHVCVGPLPQIHRRAARLDTGCGGEASGRLTALLWPSLDYLQVDSDGRLVAHPNSQDPT